MGNLSPEFAGSVRRSGEISDCRKEPAFFDYELSRDRIAQRPCGSGSSRAEARLLWAKCAGGRVVSIRDEIFCSLPSLLRSGDLLILNNSRVIPARFFSRRESDGREFEVLLLERIGDGGSWRMMARPLSRLKLGDRLVLSKNLLATVVEGGHQFAGLVLQVQNSRGDFGSEIEALMECEGLMPIPPYIRGGRADEADVESYQTVFAGEPGSIAAPTAGLHFSEDMPGRLAEAGIETAVLTLHVGAASIVPFERAKGENGRPMAERYYIPEHTAESVLRARADGRRIVAVGTTSARALENEALRGESAFCGGRWREADIFIQPGHLFSFVDALITNFHQPRTSHLLLVSAFAGAEAAESIYRHALKRDYRFLSYGDAVFLER